MRLLKNEHKMAFRKCLYNAATIQLHRSYVKKKYLQILMKFHDDIFWIGLSLKRFKAPINGLLRKEK